MLRPNAPYAPNRYGSNTLSLKLRLCIMSNLESTGNDEFAYYKYIFRIASKPYS